MQSIQSPPCIYSSLADDPDLAGQVERFVSRLAQRVEPLRSIAEQQDWETLGQRAHQISCTGTSYGFEQVARSAAQLENACRVEQQMLELLDEMLEVCGQVCAGSPTEQASSSVG